MASRGEARRQRPDVRNAHAPEGMHWCHLHNEREGAYLPFDQFHKNKRKVHGLSDRCKACAREYRRAHEKRYGKRSSDTKTVRVANGLHAFIVKACQRRGLIHPEYVAAAVRFYEKHGCIRGKCQNPGVTRFGGICTTHWYADAENKETA